MSQPIEAATAAPGEKRVGRRSVAGLKEAITEVLGPDYRVTSISLTDEGLVIEAQPNG